MKGEGGRERGGRDVQQEWESDYERTSITEREDREK